jgi:hypothetical protein
MFFVDLDFLRSRPNWQIARFGNFADMHLGNGMCDPDQFRQDYSGPRPLRADLQGLLEAPLPCLPVEISWPFNCIYCKELGRLAIYYTCLLSVIFARGFLVYGHQSIEIFYTLRVERTLDQAVSFTHLFDVNDLYARSITCLHRGL